MRIEEVQTGETLVLAMAAARDVTMHEVASRASPVPVAIAGTGCENTTMRPGRLHVDLEILGDDLLPGIHRVWANTTDELRKRLASPLEVHAWRAAQLAACGRMGTRGWVAEGVPALLASAGLDLETAMHLLERRPSIAFHFGSRKSRRGWLAWLGGELVCAFRDTKACIVYNEDRLSIWNRQLDESAKADLPGRRLDFLTDHPSLPADAIIAGVEDCTPYGGLTVRLEHRRAPLPAS